MNFGQAFKVGVHMPRYSHTYKLRKSINDELIKQGINLNQMVFCAAALGTTMQTTAVLPTATGTTPTIRTTTTDFVLPVNTINSQSLLFYQIEREQKREQILYKVYFRCCFKQPNIFYGETQVVSILKLKPVFLVKFNLIFIKS